MICNPTREVMKKNIILLFLLCIFGKNYTFHSELVHAFLFLASPAYHLNPFRDKQAIFDKLSEQNVCAELEEKVRFVMYRNGFDHEKFVIKKIRQCLCQDLSFFGIGCLITIDNFIFMDELYWNNRPFQEFEGAIVREMVHSNNNVFWNRHKFRAYLLIAMYLCSSALRYSLNLSSSSSLSYAITILGTSICDAALVKYNRYAEKRADIEASLNLGSTYQVRCYIAALEKRMPLSQFPALKELLRLLSGCPTFNDRMDYLDEIEKQLESEHNLK
jgi:hypothetical protein